MFKDVALVENSSYYSYEIDYIAEQVSIHADSLHMKSIMLEAYLDETGMLPLNVEIQYLKEDVAQVKQRIITALEKLIDVIQRLSVKFQNMVFSLVAKNKKWVEKIKGNLTEDKIKDDFEYEIYPYWKATSKLIGYNIKEFQESNQEFLDDLEDDKTFKEKYFKDLFVTIDGKSVYDPKMAFRGDVKKTTMNKSMFLSQMRNMFNFIENYQQNSKNIIDRNQKFLDILKRGVAQIRSAVFRESSTDLFLETMNSLLEQDKPVTTADVNKEQDGGDNKQDDPQKEPDTATSEVKDIVEKRQRYTTICYGINSARMAIMEECYNSYVRAIVAAQVKSKKK